MSQLRRKTEQMSADLPAALRRQFALLERRLWKIETVTAACFAASALIASYLVLFVSDRFWDSPVWSRMLGAAIGAAVLGWAAWRWLRLWVFRRRDLRALADLVQKRFSRLGDRLLGIVELSSEQQHAPDFSPSLYRAAIDQVATEAQQYNFREAVSPRRAKRFLAVTLSLAVSTLVAVLILPAAGWNVFLRWLAPVAQIERYTVVRLADLPDELVVPHGEPFVVGGRVRYDSFWRPTRASARIERQAKIAGRVSGGALSLRVPGQIQRGVLAVKVGDAQKQITILPTHRPSLKELAATVKLPDYLEQTPEEQPVRSGALSVLEGSRVSFHGKASRALTAAQLRLGEDTPIPLTVAGQEFSSDFVGRDGTFQCAFNWRDALGLSNSPPLRLTVRTQKDAPPVPHLPELPRDVAMLHSDVLEIQSRAQDDFGVRMLGLHWEIVSGVAEPQGAATTEIRIDSRSRKEKTLEKTFQWSPAQFRVPPDSSLELVAFANDFLPERERTLSPVHRLYVLGEEKHAELVRQRLDGLLSRLEEITRLEEKILASTLQAQQAELTNATGRIEGAKNDQLRNTAQLEQLVAEGAQTLREALKNPLVPEEVVRQWTQNLQAMQQLSQQPMKQAAASLQSAQQNMASRPQDLARAEKNEREALETLAEMQRRMNQQLDDLKALTLSQRLRQVGGWESEIEAQLRKIAPETIGLLPKELPERFRKINASLADAQGTAQVEAQALQGEINRFFERTQKTNYGAVAMEMTEARTVDELDRLRGMIAENIGMQAALSSADWSQRFHEWADTLEPKELCSACSGDGSGDQQVDLTRMLIALLRLRQSEMNLREQTRLLEEQQGEKGEYGKRAAELAGTQKRLTRDLNALHEDNVIAELDEPFGQTQELMQHVEVLLDKPQTDSATDHAEVQVIESLSDLINLINEQAQRRQPRPGEGEGSGAEEMAFLLQMMTQANRPGQSMAMGQTGVGNLSGGTTDRTGTPAGGDAGGNAPRERRVNRASGASESWPVEFREALEKYFKAVEEDAR